AAGEQEWQSYLIGWHQSYFAPAIARAQQQLRSLERPAKSPPATLSPAPPQASKSQVSQVKPSNAKPSKNQCPTCNQLMDKIPTRSKKLKAKHFLKCSGCSTVMFWNGKAKRYDLPYAQQQANTPENFTDSPCPVCGALLERYRYQKQGQDKVMLRCSLLENRRGQCKEVAFFESRGEFWSPKFGTLKLPEPQL
ncbi:MAG: DNA topoisomerase I, partial [Leptolyngbya sp. SIO4C5]|nr:DNA topoisomerase I [Leptolyngbya sp. SIO4C5]